MLPAYNDSTVIGSESLAHLIFERVWGFGFGVGFPLLQWPFGHGMSRQYLFLR